jgi:hypothetical protein
MYLFSQYTNGALFIGLSKDKTWFEIGFGTQDYEKDTFRFIVGTFRENKAATVSVVEMDFAPKHRRDVAPNNRVRELVQRNGKR